MSPEGTVVAVSRSDVYSFTKPERAEIVLVAGIGVEGDAHAGVRVRHRSRVKADPDQPNLRQVHLMQAELFGEVRAKGYRVEPGELGENVTTSGIDLLGLPLGTVLRFGSPADHAAAVRGGAPGGTSGTGAAGGTASAARDGTGAAAATATAARNGTGAAAATGGTGSTAELVDAGVVGVGAAEAWGRAGPSAVAGVLAAATGARLDEAAEAAVGALREAAGRDSEEDPRPAVIVTGLRNPCAQINRFQEGLLSEVVGRDDGGKLVRRAGVMAVVLRGGPIRSGDVIAVELPSSAHVPLDRV